MLDFLKKNFKIMGSKFSKLLFLIIFIFIIIFVFCFFAFSIVYFFSCDITDAMGYMWLIIVLFYLGINISACIKKRTNLKYFHNKHDDILTKVISKDNNFSVVNFRSYATNIFLLIGLVWVSKDYRKIRAFVGDSLYYKLKSEIDNDEQKKFFSLNNNVYYSFLWDFSSDNTYEFLSILLVCTPNLLSLDKKNSKGTSFCLKFSRKKDTKTKPNIVMSTTNCSNCGAVINVNDDGICNYCHTSVIVKDDNWKLIDIKLY